MIIDIWQLWQQCHRSNNLLTIVATITIIEVMLIK
jgi:hypothetical protein